MQGLVTWMVVILSIFSVIAGVLNHSRKDYIVVSVIALVLDILLMVSGFLWDDPITRPVLSIPLLLFMVLRVGQRLIFPTVAAVAIERKDPSS